jgi:hypothetical protein
MQFLDDYVTERCRMNVNVIFIYDCRLNRIRTNLEAFRYPQKCQRCNPHVIPSSFYYSFTRYVTTLVKATYVVESQRHFLCTWAGARVATTRLVHVLVGVMQVALNKDIQVVYIHTRLTVKGFRKKFHRKDNCLISGN